MANPTTNFGWVMPTSTSLVTNLPADFNTFGQGVDTSMAQLKGGTTGQILSKTSATDMAFTWITPNPGDITGVTAGTGISGGGTSGDVTITNSMATAMTTKGDLVPATGSGTFSRLAVGTNGQTLVADSSTATGLKWATPSAASAVGASVYRASTTIAYTANTEILLTPDTLDYDTNSFWSSGTNPSRLTIPSGYAGKYLITMTTRVNIGTSYAYMYLYKNGARVAVGLESGFFARQVNMGSNSTAFMGSVVLNCAVGDYFQVYWQGDCTNASHNTWLRYSISYQGA